MALQPENLHFVVSYKRLEKGRFAAVCDRERSRAVKLTLSELTQFIEGSETIGRSPALLTLADLTPRWPEEPKKIDDT